MKRDMRKILLSLILLCGFSYVGFGAEPPAKKQKTGEIEKTDTENAHTIEIVNAYGITISITIEKGAKISDLKTIIREEQGIHVANQFILQKDTEYPLADNIILDGSSTKFFLSIEAVDIEVDSIEKLKTEVKSGKLINSLTLDIHNDCRLGDVGAQHIANSLREMSSLTSLHLDLRCNNIKENEYSILLILSED